MSKLEELINKLCPNGVEFKKLIEITTWDKKFNGIDNSYKKIFKHISAEQLKKFNSDSGNIKLLSTGIFDGYAEEEKCKEFINEGDVLTLPSGGTANIKYFSGKFLDSGNIIAITRDEKKYNIKYIYYNLINIQSLIQSFYRGSGVKHPDMANILNISIPVPPLEVQCEIVRILDNFTLLSAELSAELSARQKQYEYYKNLLLEPKANYKNVKFMKLRDIGQVKMCKRILKSQTNSISGIPFYKIGTFGKEPDAYISEETYKEYINKYNYPKKGDILISCAGTIGRTIVYDGQPAYFQDSNIVWLEHNEKIVLNKYLMYCYSLEPWNISTGGTIARLYNDNILRAEIPVPPLEEQERIVNILDRFDKLCNDISEGLPAEIEARKKQYEYYRDKLLTFKELKSNER